MITSVVMLLPSLGCQLCCDGDELSYPAYGGAWQRTRRDGGRVGSLFDPAGGRAAVLINRDDPTSVDEQYRDRESERTADDKAPDEKDPDEKEADDAESKSKPLTDDEEAAELKRRSDRIKDLELDDISIVPGEPAPPQLQ